MRPFSSHSAVWNGWVLKHIPPRASWSSQIVTRTLSKCRLLNSPFDHHVHAVFLTFPCLDQFMRIVRHASEIVDATTQKGDVTCWTCPATCGITKPSSLSSLARNCHHSCWAKSCWWHRHSLWLVDFPLFCFLNYCFPLSLWWFYHVLSKCYHSFSWNSMFFWFCHIISRCC